MSGKIYVGTRDGAWVEEVKVNGQKLFNYDQYGDPDNGFEWGYGGAGPYALALSILCDHLGLAPGVNPDTHRDQLYPYVQYFKEEVIAGFPHNAGFTLTSEQIAEWLAGKRSESRTQTSRQ